MDGPEAVSVDGFMGIFCKLEEGHCPLFRFEDSRPLTRTMFVQEVKHALEEAGTSSY